MYEETPKGQLLCKIVPIMEIKQIEGPRYLGELANSLVLLDHPKIIRQ